MEIQQVEHFIGRDQELAQFNAWFADPQAPWILYFHDAAEEKERKGGVGKTWLMRRCAELVRQTDIQTAVVTIDFFNTADRDGVVIAERVVTMLQSLYPDWSPTALTSALKQYRTEEQGNAIATETIDFTEIRLHHHLSTALETDLHELERKLAHTHKSLLIFFDTYELIERNPVMAVLKPSQTFPDPYSFEHIGVVIAGRNKIDWTHPNWKGRQQEVLVIPLAPFNLQEMVHYIDTESIYDIPPQSTQAAVLYDRVEGRPILVGLVADVLNHRVLSLDELIAVPKTEFERHLVTQINKLDNPLNWIVLFMAHIYHRFNLNIFQWLLNESNLKYVVHDIDYQELLTTLPSLSFVRRPGSGHDFVLHDEMRRLVVKYCWELQDADQSIRQEISHCIIRYYEDQVVQTQSLQEQQVYTVEILYHKLFLDIEDGLNYFQSRFLKAINQGRISFARALLQETQIFEKNMSGAQRHDMMLMEAKQLRAEENPSAALDLHRKLEQSTDGDWLKTNRTDVLFEKGRCYQQLSRFTEAVACFTESLEIEKARNDEGRYAYLLGLLGLIYRRRGQLDVAMRYYKDCINLYKSTGNVREYANILNNMSNVYRLQGKIEEALRWCRTGWRIRLELFQEGKGTELPVGLSLSTLGIIYLDTDDMDEAEHCFHQAFDIFHRLSYKKGIASTYNRFGQVELKKGALKIAMEWFRKAQEVAVDVDAEAYISSLYYQGRVYTRKQMWEEAAAAFQQAIDIAQQVHDDYQHAQSLINLGEALIYLGQEQAAYRAWQETERIATRENYVYLLGWCEEVQGELLYKNADYERAFNHFVKYCHHMALYNALEFNTSIRKITAALLGIPKQEIPAIVDLFTAYWLNQQLEKRFPELINSCEEVKLLITM